MRNYKILEYRTREEVTNVLDLIVHVAKKDEFGKSTAENRVTVPSTHTRQGKGQRRKKQSQKQQRWVKQG